MSIISISLVGTIGYEIFSLTFLVWLPLLFVGLFGWLLFRNEVSGYEKWFLWVGVVLLLLALNEIVGLWLFSY